MIQVKGLQKSFDKFKALDGVEMHVGKGNIYGLDGEKRLDFLPEDFCDDEESETLLFLGCSVYTHPEIALAAIKLLNAGRTCTPPFFSRDSSARTMTPYPAPFSNSISKNPFMFRSERYAAVRSHSKSGIRRSTGSNSTFLRSGCEEELFFFICRLLSSRSGVSFSGRNGNSNGRSARRRRRS